MNIHYVVAKNAIEAEMFARRAFDAAKSSRDLKTALHHDTSKGQVYKATRNGMEISIEACR